MPERVAKCLKCSGAMEEGIVLDRGHGNLPSAESHWLEGSAKTNWWGALKTSGKRMLPIATWRCTVCGFLESYAS